MNIVIYARVSTKDQNVEQQVKDLEQYATMNGHAVRMILADKESGTVPISERKGFIKLLEYAKANSCAVLVFNIDRLTRNWDDVTFIEKVFRKNWSAMKLVSAHEQVDFGSATGRMMFRIKMAVSCYMPEDMKEKQRSAIDRAMLEGKFKGGKVGRRKGKGEK